MRLLLLLCTFLLCLYGEASSNDYSIIIKGPFDGALFDITEGHDRELNAVGYSQHFKSAPSLPREYSDAFDYLSSLQSDRGEQIRLIKLNSSGESTLDKSMNLPSFNRAVSLINTPSGGYFVGGTMQNGEMLVLNLGSSASINFLHRFGTSNSDRMHRLLALRDGGVLSIGSSVTSRSFSDNLYEQGLGLNDIYLTRFSKSGQKLWSKKYGTANDDYGIAAAEADDGSIIVAGSTQSAKGKQITLMRLSENGDKVWLKPYGKNGRLTPHDIIALDGGGFLLSLSVHEEGKKEEQIRLVKFDLQGNITAEQSVVTQRSSALLSIKEQANGRVIGVGYSTDMKKADTDALAILFDLQLNTLWQHRYGGSNRDLFRSVAVLHDGRFAAAGETVSPGSEISNMWVVKLNDDGSIAMKSSSGKSLYDALIEAFADDIANKRITITKDLSITLIYPALLFKAGVYELTDAQKRFLNGFSKTLLKVLDPYRAEIAGLRINGHTSSEWQNTDFTDRYLNNAKLSTQRAYSILSHIFIQKQTASYRLWLSSILTNNGYAFSQLVKRPQEDREASRRAEFQIILQ